ncbi:unnamed protein product [Amoebophrya sp. A120]|nr:unnamed protein product [Amoebophrya sp. A120]|eukprot:GSA120T00021987001.1
MLTGSSPSIDLVTLVKEAHTTTTAFGNGQGTSAAATASDYHFLQRLEKALWEKREQQLALVEEEDCVAAQNKSRHAHSARSTQSGTSRQHPPASGNIKTQEHATSSSTVRQLSTAPSTSTSTAPSFGLNLLNPLTYKRCLELSSSKEQTNSTILEKIDNINQAGRGRGGRATDSDFEAVDKLQSLHLEWQRLQPVLSLPLHPFRSLKNLYLQYNFLTDGVWDELIGLDQLELLALQHNRLTTVKANFQNAGFGETGGKALLVLDCSSNRITDWNFDTLATHFPQSLCILNVADNPDSILLIEGPPSLHDKQAPPPRSHQRTSTEAATSSTSITRRKKLLLDYLPDLAVFNGSDLERDTEDPDGESKSDKGEEGGVSSKFLDVVDTTKVLDDFPPAADFHIFGEQEGTEENNTKPSSNDSLDHHAVEKRTLFEEIRKQMEALELAEKVDVPDDVPEISLTSQQRRFLARVRTKNGGCHEEQQDYDYGGEDHVEEKGEDYDCGAGDVDEVELVDAAPVPSLHQTANDANHIPTSGPTRTAATVAEVPPPEDLDLRADEEVLQALAAKRTLLRRKRILEKEMQKEIEAFELVAQNKTNSGAGATSNSFLFRSSGASPSASTTRQSHDSTSTEAGVPGSSRNTFAINERMEARRQRRELETYEADLPLEEQYQIWNTARKLASEASTLVVPPEGEAA